MPECKTLIEIKAITDHETGMYRIGEVDWSYNSTILEDHIKANGVEELLLSMTYLIGVIHVIKQEINNKNVDTASVSKE